MTRRDVSPRLSFALGETVLIIALVSPVDPLGETLLSAHMAQHALLVAVAPPLLLLGRPGVAFAWALPNRRRRDFLLSTGWRWLAGLGEALSRPLPAAVLQGLTFGSGTGASFADASPQEQDELLTRLEAGEEDLDGVPSAIFFETLLANTIEGYFADPAYGGNRDMAGWRMIGFSGAYAAYLGMYTRHGVRFEHEPISMADAQRLHRHR